MDDFFPVHSYTTQTGSTRSPTFLNFNYSHMAHSPALKALLSQVNQQFDHEKPTTDKLPEKRQAGHIPRPMNAFMVWAKKERKILQISHSTLRNIELSKLLGDKWKNMTTEEKQPYLAAAEDLKKQHKKDYPYYKYRPRRRLNKKRPQDHVAPAAQGTVLAQKTLPTSTYSHMLSLSNVCRPPPLLPSQSATFHRQDLPTLSPRPLQYNSNTINTHYSVPLSRMVSSEVPQTNQWSKGGGGGAVSLRRTTSLTSDPYLINRDWSALPACSQCATQTPLNHSGGGGIVSAPPTCSPIGGYQPTTFFPYDTSPTSTQSPVDADQLTYDDMPPYISNFDSSFSHPPTTLFQQQQQQAYHNSPGSLQTNITSYTHFPASLLDNPFADSAHCGELSDSLSDLEPSIGFALP